MSTSGHYKPKLLLLLFKPKLFDLKKSKQNNHLELKYEIIYALIDY